MIVNFDYRSMLEAIIKGRFEFLAEVHRTNAFTTITLEPCDLWMDAWYEGDLERGQG